MESELEPQFGSFLYWRLPILAIPEEIEQEMRQTRHETSNRHYRANFECDVGVVACDDVISDCSGDWSADDEAEDSDSEVAPTSVISTEPVVQSVGAPASLRLQLLVDGYQVRLQRAVSSYFVCNDIVLPLALSTSSQVCTFVGVDMLDSCGMDVPVLHAIRFSSSLLASFLVALALRLTYLYGCDVCEKALGKYLCSIQIIHRTFVVIWRSSGVIAICNMLRCGCYTFKLGVERVALVISCDKT